MFDRCSPSRRGAADARGAPTPQATSPSIAAPPPLYRTTVSSTLPVGVPPSSRGSARTTEHPEPVVIGVFEPPMRTVLIGVSDDCPEASPRFLPPTPLRALVTLFECGPEQRRRQSSDDAVPSCRTVSVRRQLCFVSQRRSLGTALFAPIPRAVSHVLRPQALGQRPNGWRCAASRAGQKRSSRSTWARAGAERRRSAHPSGHRPPVPSPTSATSAPSHCSAAIEIACVQDRQPSASTGGAPSFAPQPPPFIGRRAPLLPMRVRPHSRRRASALPQPWLSSVPLAGAGPEVGTPPLAPPVRSSLNRACAPRFPSIREAGCPSLEPRSCNSPVSTRGRSRGGLCSRTARRTGHPRPPNGVARSRRLFLQQPPSGHDALEFTAASPAGLAATMSAPTSEAPNQPSDNAPGPPQRTGTPEAHRRPQGSSRCRTVGAVLRCGQAADASRGAVPERSSGTRPRSAHGAAPTKEALRHH